jgi:hypothetical protein
MVVKQEDWGGLVGRGRGATQAWATSDNNSREAMTTTAGGESVAWQAERATLESSTINNGMEDMLALSV